MGSGVKYHLNFHLHMPLMQFHHHHHHHHHQQHHHHAKKEFNHIPKGCLAILVGQGDEQQRFIIPVMYMNHPLFMQLLKEAEEEYGFHHTGPIIIPCHVEEFRNVQAKIDEERSHHHHHHHYWCFKD